jgi:hypothetical protein
LVDWIGLLIGDELLIERRPASVKLICDTALPMVGRVMEGMQLAKWARRIAMIDGGNVGDKKVDMRLRKVGRQGLPGYTSEYMYSQVLDEATIA